MKIQKIAITGFKNYLERVEFTFGDKTLITADNAKGKTTIGEAIAWALTGCDIYGTEKATARLINSSAKVTEVDVDFEHNGEMHNITRRKKGNATDVYLDGNKTTNADIYRDFLKDKDTFFTIFNPMYFTALSPKDAKEYLLRILPNISNAEVFAELGGYIKNLLINDGFKNANTYLEDRRRELVELEKDIIYCEGIIDGQNSETEIPEEMEFDNTELLKLEKQLADLQSQVPDNSKVTEIEKKIAENRVRLQSVPFERPQLIDEKSLNQRFEELRIEYSKVKNQYINLGTKTVQCKNCGNDVDVNELEKQRLLDRLAEIEKKGVETQRKYQEACKSNQETTTQFNEKLKTFQDEISKQIQELNNELQIVKDEIQRNDQGRARQIYMIKEMIQGLRDSQQRVLIHNQNRLNLINQQESATAKVSEASEKIEKNKARIAEINMLIDLAKQFNAKKLELESEEINQYLNKVSVQLQKVIKSTGELKEDFKVLYDGREFNVLSHSERIKAGLEIINLTMHLLNIKFPIFIDDAESITRYEKPDTQIIEARVVEGKELSVEVA